SLLLPCWRLLEDWDSNSYASRRMRGRRRKILRRPKTPHPPPPCPRPLLLNLPLPHPWTALRRKILAPAPALLLQQASLPPLRRNLTPRKPPTRSPRTPIPRR